MEETVQRIDDLGWREIDFKWVWIKRHARQEEKLEKRKALKRIDETSWRINKTWQDW